MGIVTKRGECLPKKITFFTNFNDNIFEGGFSKKVTNDDIIYLGGRGPGGQRLMIYFFNETKENRLKRQNINFCDQGGRRHSLPGHSYCLVLVCHQGTNLLSVAVRPPCDPVTIGGLTSI